MLNVSCSSEIGCVSAVSVRKARGAAPVRVDHARLIAGAGIEGDVHADPLSLRQLLIADEATYRDLRLPAHALRENLLVSFDTSTLRSGTLLRVGSEAMLWLTFQCEACGHLNNHRADLSKVIGIRRGMLARVIRGGVIRGGDAITNLGPLLPPWSDDWRDRVRKVLDAVPRHLVIEYKQLARLSGVPSSYCRVFPRVIRDFGATYVKKALPKQGMMSKARWDGVELFNNQTTECPVHRVSDQYAVSAIVSPTKVNPMDSVRSNAIKEQLVGSLRQSEQGTVQMLEIGGAKVLLTQSRKFRHDNTPEPEAKPYPAVACAVADEYDSWLR
jgi:hypothetical protein